MRSLKILCFLLLAANVAFEGMRKLGWFEKGWIGRAKHKVSAWLDAWPKLQAALAFCCVSTVLFPFFDLVALPFWLFAIFVYFAFFVILAILFAYKPDLPFKRFWLRLAAEQSVVYAFYFSVEVADMLAVKVFDTYVHSLFVIEYSLGRIIETRLESWPWGLLFFAVAYGFGWLVRGCVMLVRRIFRMNE